ncbi:SusC/RagA family TonB-linked outer membrane protein [Portibacter marinus]|uniref:SusC/RagA family TonB-linked outer membrane protein n=1 Tax=Portibacter marinus TaxID=2898660 RepID=UPI001F3DDAE2|nr:TonB-dependent receptor [Portibacter marinus]
MTIHLMYYLMLIAGTLGINLSAENMTFEKVAILNQSVFEVSGQITDSEGEPLIGATVQEKGTSIGTTTDIDGTFNLEVSSEEAILVVSYIGYTTQEVQVQGQSEINIIMEENAAQLDEVVVVGYGTVRKSDVVGAVSSVDVEEATAIPSTNVSEMLRGRAAGVQVNLADARPGGNSNIVIRGKVSLVGNDPLIIVDGVPYDNINDVAPEDIKSIEVLKDASSQAIYGARAANGVILITTRRGKEGKVQVDYHGYSTTQVLTKNFDLFSGPEFAQVRREAVRTENGDEYLNDEIIFEPQELQSLEEGSFVDWEELLIQNAVLQSHALTLSGGGERTKFYTSFNYFGQDGIIPTSGFNRGTIRLNVDQKINEKLNLQANVNFQKNFQDIESGSINYITISPLARPFDENGNIVKFPLGEGSTTVSPLWNIQESDNKIETTLTDLNFVANYDIINGLSYKLNTFLRNRGTDQGIYRSTQHSEADADIQGLATLRNEFYREYLIENIVNYSPVINASNVLDFTFVQATNQRDNEETAIVKSGFPNDALGFNGNASFIRGNTRDVSRRRLVSFLGRARYNLMNRYLLTLTMRADGSSVFAENNKWGYFPAAAVAWKIHEEPFIRDSRALTQLKLRVSYGSTGNEGINPSESLGLADYLPYTFGGITHAGFAPLSRLPNPNLKWETTTTLNIGVDFGLWNNRWLGSIEAYHSSTTDFLLDRVLAGTTGFEVTRFNIGEVENRGVEMTTNYDVLRSPNLRWNIGAVWSANRNKILSLDGSVDENGEPIDFLSQGLFIGQPIDNIRQRVFDGIFQSEEEIANSAQPDAIVGDIRVKDLNDDGQITDDDRRIFRENPDWYGSINTSVNWRNFELFADVYIVEGATRLNPYLADFALGGTLQGSRNGIRRDYFTPESPSNTAPRPRPGTPSNLFALAVQDASYVRLRTLTIGYTLPKSLLDRIRLRNTKIYFTGTNLLTFTDYLSYSPENNPGAFPEAKGYTVGLKIGI